MPLNNQKVENRSEGRFKKSLKSSANNSSLFITWGIMGFWHGANWTFLLWGVYHATLIKIYRLIEPSTRTFSNSLRSVLGISVTIPLIMLSWIPFRATSLSEGLNMWAKIINPFEYTWLGMRENIYLITFVVFMGFYVVFLFKEKVLPKFKSFRLIIVLFDIILMVFVSSLVIIFFRSINQFIYFQF